MSQLGLAKVRLKNEDLPEAARWAADLTVNLPRGIVSLIESRVFLEGRAPQKSEAAAAANALRESNAFHMQPPATTRLPFSYRAIPGPFRRAVGRVIGRLQRERSSQWARFPGWPLDLSADLLNDLAGSPRHRFGRTPVLLTHDIDSPEGLVNLVEMFLPEEERVGARSANYIVPAAWPLDHTRLEEVAARGHEIGIHGFDHSGRMSFLSPEERARRLAAGRQLGDRYAARGYRSPSLIRSRELLADLSTLYEYDSSIPTSGGPFPSPNNGCASARPWQIDGLWELPITLPRDGTLRFLGHRPDEIADLWLRCAEVIRLSGGIVSLLTHCERGFSGNPAMLRAYRRFIGAMAEDDRFHFMRPADLVSLVERHSDE